MRLFDADEDECLSYFVSVIGVFRHLVVVGDCGVIDVGVYLFGVFREELFLLDLLIPGYGKWK